MTLLNVIRLKPTEVSILITITQCFWLYFIISWIFVFDAGHNHSNYHAHYVSLIISLNDGPVRVLSQTEVSVQWWRDLCLPDLQLSDAPRLVQTPDCVTLSHTEVHSPGARVPARHCLRAVWIITFQLESTLVIPSRAILSCVHLNDGLKGCGGYIQLKPTIQ